MTNMNKAEPNAFNDKRFGERYTNSNGSYYEGGLFLL